MLLTISTTHRPATDLGYLLHKHPDRLQSINLSVGKAHLFYPESSAEKTTLAMLLDIDAIEMVRGSKNLKASGFSLQQYVNDRPYVASSFMSVAISKAFGTAMNGTCADRPEIVEKALPFEVTISVLAAPKGGQILIRKMFEPLGYIGASGSGKSTFAKTYFSKHEYVSSDFCRGVVSNDENSLAASKDAFELLGFIVAQRLRKGLLTVIDATNVAYESRKTLLNIAREYHVLPVAIVLNIPAEICEERNKSRQDRNFGKRVVYRQIANLRRSLKGLKKEGFKRVTVLKSVAEVDSVKLTRARLYSDKKDISGPFDIIGDIHGCYDECVDLLGKLDYRIQTVDEADGNYGISVTHPDSRQVIFLGDLVDRGPNSPAVLKLVMSMVRSGVAFCVPGNHDAKLQRKLRGRSVKMTHGLEETMQQMSEESDAFREDVREFIFSLISHLIFDGGNLLVVHAGLKADMHGRASGAVRAFCLYGETSGEVDDYGLPVRHDWAASYSGRRGHPKRSRGKVS